MKFCLVTRRHHLYATLWRLAHEGHEVSVVQMDPRYREAWEGRLHHVDVVPPGTDTIVLTDTAQHGEVPFPAGQLALGFWLTGSLIHSYHLWLPDVGLWPGGLGARTITGGLVAPFPQGVPEWALALAKEVAARQSPKGWALAQVALTGAEGRLVPAGTWIGFPWLHWEAFSATLPRLTPLFDAGATNSCAGGYGFALPVSVPPWPFHGGAAPRRFEVPPEALALLSLCDVRSGEGGFETAGGDGLVAVARGAGPTPEWARGRALLAAGALAAGLPEAQVRNDVGLGAVTGLMGLERLGLWAP